MTFKIYFITSVIILVFPIPKVMHAAEPENPCPRQLDHIMVDMCSDDSVVEDSVYGTKVVDSVLLRITKQQNNCICHVSLQNTFTNYTIYMSKYDGQPNAAPEQQKCGLAVDVDYVDTSDTTRSLQSIECNSGTSIRSIALGGNELKLKSRILAGDFTRGYCMQIFKNQAIYTCNMIDQVNYAGKDGDWIVTNGTQHTSSDECKQYCRNTETCVAVHYEHKNNYCFVYNQTTSIELKDNSTYSQKHCVDTQKLKIRCFPPESTTQTSRGTTTESTTKTSQVYPPESTTKTSQGYLPESTTKIRQGTTTEDNRSTKTKTVTTPISDSSVTSSYTQSTIAAENDTTKDENSDLYVYLGAGAGGVLMILLLVSIIMCIRKRSNEASLKESKNYSTKQFCSDSKDSDNDYDGLKDNILYVSSEQNDIVEDGNTDTVDLEQNRKVHQRITSDGDYSTVDGKFSTIGSDNDSSLSKSKPVIKPKPKTNANVSFKRGSDEETIHLSTMDNDNNEYAVVDKGRNSDAVKHINPVYGNDTEYAVVDKVRKSSNNN
ncbi:uncharacterized protein LOC127725204 isoform X2 [Mytilus californianus]|uniref:uncharacterized protein LOC127725204 isoform X2 n=1 Tax=Mytilus californianus TaxID=6549 RepID=UPI002245F9DE|nr:uncharacterized protein LOC127725204 isoform X2 [Mytilus californianus]